MANLGGLFYKQYYEGVFEKNSESDKCSIFSKKNSELFEAQSVEYEYFTGSQTFNLKVKYPGLLVGIGNLHEARYGSDDLNNQIKMGFTFDYTTGAPIIPSSSVKGALRSAFAHSDYIIQLLGGITENADFKGLNVKSLENEIFGDENAPDLRPVYGRDRFFDAFILKYDKNKRSFLAPDTITPHRQNKVLELAEPVPIKFVKVPAGIVFTFSFELNDSSIYKGISSEVKRRLFKQIILDLGIGAKTNVGYGVMEDWNEYGRREHKTSRVPV